MNTYNASTQSIVIVLATYNGCRFIEEQVKSIQAQTLSDWQLIIRDDGSMDNTVSIVERLMGNDSRIQLIHDESNPQRGPVSNFNTLMAHARSLNPDYIAFADQDDYWIEGKLENQLQSMQTIENKKGCETPVLICSDLKVSDVNLKTIHRSFMEYQKIKNPFNPQLKTLCIQNHVVGCTAFANLALVDLAHPIPEKAYMHDWWMALCAASCGVLHYLSLPTVLYRQHGLNTAGAGGFKTAFNPFQIKWYRTINKMNKIFISAIEQWQCLYDRLKDNRPLFKNNNMMNDNIQTITHLLRILNLPKFKRIFAFYNFGLSCQNDLMSVLFYTLMMYRFIFNQGKV